MLVCNAIRSDMIATIFRSVPAEVKSWKLSALIDIKSSEGERPLLPPMTFIGVAVMGVMAKYASASSGRASLR